MTDKPSYAVKTVIAFEAHDGQKFHSLGEAQIHTRTELFRHIYRVRCAARPEFARLDQDLLVEFLFASTPILAQAMTEPFNPMPLPNPSKPPAAAPAAEPERAMPAARADAAPTPTVAAKLVSAAQRGLESVRSVRDPGFPPRTEPVANEVRVSYGDTVAALEAELDLPAEGGQRRGYAG